MKIKCTNCGFEGDAKMVPKPLANALFWLSVVATVIAFIVALGSLLPWVLLATWLVLGILTAHVAIRPVCPTCGWIYVVRTSTPASPSKPPSKGRS